MQGVYAEELHAYRATHKATEVHMWNSEEEDTCSMACKLEGLLRALALQKGLDLESPTPSDSMGAAEIRERVVAAVWEAW